MSFAGAYRAKLSLWGVSMQDRATFLRSNGSHPSKSEAKQSAHHADQHVGRQIAMVRVQSDVHQAQLARSIGVSFQQLQKYESARNRVSASMLYEIGRALGVPVSRFFEGLPGNNEGGTRAPLPVDERIEFIASAEGRRLIEGLMRLSPRVRARVSTLIAALGDELEYLDSRSGAMEPGGAERGSS